MNQNGKNMKKRPSEANKSELEIVAIKITKLLAKIFIYFAFNFIFSYFFNEHIYFIFCRAL